MKPLLPCEVIVKRYLPGLRAWIAKSLVTDYHMTQMEVAAKLGITQAAVSKYLSGKYDDKLKDVLRNEKLVADLKEITRKLALDKIDRDSLVMSFCQTCAYMRDGVVCEFNDTYYSKAKN